MLLNRIVVGLLSGVTVILVVLLITVTCELDLEGERQIQGIDVKPMKKKMLAIIRRALLVSLGT